MLDPNAILRRLVADIRVELTDEFDRNFQRKAFFTEKWKKRRDKNAKGTLLVVTGTLRRSIQAKATTTDDKERAKIEQALDNMTNSFWGLFPEGTDIEIKESSRGDAFNVYDRRVDRCNSEISKGILNQTMTIDAGSSLSQSETHLDVFETVTESDQRMLSYVVNDRLLPLMASHGFPVAGCQFAWDDATAFTPSEQREAERLLLEYYEIDPQYFIDK